MNYSPQTSSTKSLKVLSKITWWIGWRGEHPQYDCTFVTTNLEFKGVCGMDVMHILIFFTFVLHGKQYPCTVVPLFVHSEEHDENMGMWTVFPGFNSHCQPDISIIHLIPVYGTQEISPEIHPHHSYDIFHACYVNKFADHQTFEIAL
ncbi:hypothetical protein PAXRUDRAFT_163985 [Paxillus rubicundulus Ve08.2h10]|uniref:Uncharacterized protein n=1 Tax=Paxillus rubicundulus Ve08.2h10 TaxID=930991 RepID=A0A0D0DJX2_9AGAM|nr:hypothetical protein PAXRUDRAFT_163985 [Paxillus rubicundulus Ve08.2h10]